MSPEQSHYGGRVEALKPERQDRPTRESRDVGRPADQSGTWLNAFTVDVEDYFQVSAFENEVPRNSWNSYPSRVVANTLRLLEKLSDNEVYGTFFVVGWIAERFPDLVLAIRQAGHEIGSHSYWHRLIYNLTPDEFRDDLTRSRNALEDILGEPIQIFRAPSFLNYAPIHVGT